jgi:hypothetical protein
MAYNFTDATLLGYQVNKNYLGEGLFTLNTTKNISIEGILDNRITNIDSEGVKENYQRITDLLTGIVNAYDAVTLNGYFLGSGKVLSVSFPEQNPVRIGIYRYEIEILENSDFTNIQTGDIYGTFLSGVSDKIVSLDENLNFDHADNGDYSYSHDINIQYYDDGSDLFTKSKNFAFSAYNDSLNVGVIGQFSGFYNALRSKKNYFSETYDLINKRCSFSKKILINKNYNTDYTTTSTHNVTLDTNGKVTVTEQGSIKALDNTLNYTAENYFDTELANSYLRCQNVYNAYIENFSNSIGALYVCDYRDNNKLSEIEGNNAPIGANFNNIAFDYTSFAVSCSLLGFDPTTILNSLGGVDFSYNYVVIRAKTSSTINADSITDLGNGVINITSSGPSGGAVNKYYRFYVMCKEGWNKVVFFGTDYNVPRIYSLYTEPFSIGKTFNHSTNTLEYTVSYVNDISFEGDIINNYNITINEDIEGIVNYSEQGDLTQVGQITTINNLETIKSKYLAAKTRVLNDYPNLKLKSSSLSLTNLNSKYINQVVIANNTNFTGFNGTYTRSFGNNKTKFIGPLNDGGAPGLPNIEIWWDDYYKWVMSYYGQADGEGAYFSNDLINWQDGAYGAFNGISTPSYLDTSTYNNNFSYSIEKTNDNSIIENNPYYKSLSIKIDDQAPYNLYKEYIIANKSPKNVLFTSGNQIEMGNRSVIINGTLVKPTGNIWNTPINFPLQDLKSKSISGALNLISDEAYIDNLSYDYDSDNNFSFSLGVKYLKATGT